ARFHDVCASAGRTRELHAHRIAVVASSARAAADALSSREGVARGRAEGAGRPVVVFGGHGTEWPGMARELLATEPVFREAIARCHEAMAHEDGFDLLAELREGDAGARADRIDVVQRVVFATQAALVTLLASWGIRPEAVIGHSLGEIAA